LRKWGFLVQMLESFSKEVVWCAFADIRLRLPWCWIELQKGILHELIDLHYCSFITTPVAVIRRRKDSDYVSLMRPVISVHNQLVSTRDQFQIVCMIELLRYILAERVSCTSGGNSPPASVVRV